MPKKLIIFGCGDIADVAHWYFTSDTDYDVEAFCVDANFMDGDIFCGQPVVPFDKNLASRYPPTEFDLFVALSYTKLNEVRKDKFLEGREMGYRLASYVSSKASVLNDGAIGENCFILEDNTIQPFVRIGDNVTLWSGNHIGHHSTIEDHVFISSHVVISGGVTIGERCFIGVNATLRDHIKIGERSVLGAGVLLLSDVEPGSVYVAKESEKSRVPSHRLKRI